MATAQATALLQRSGVRQLVKFCLVGVTSTVIDKGTLWVLLNDVMPTAPWWACASLSFCLGVTNGFVWNRGWTFRARNHGALRHQYAMFFGSNLVGLALNLAFTKAFLIMVTGEVRHRAAPPGANKVLVASLAAIPFVMLWNFTASKYWTFRPPRDAAA